MIVTVKDTVKSRLEALEIKSDTDLIEFISADNSNDIVVVSVKIAAVAIITFELMCCRECAADLMSCVI